MTLKFKLHSQTKNKILSLKGILYVLLLRSMRTFLDYLNRMMFVPILVPFIKLSYSHTVGGTAILAVR